MTVTDGAPRVDDLLQAAVNTRITALQRGVLAGTPAARSTLARLRRGLGREPGSVPDIWADTIGLLPPELCGRGDAPSDSERAVHAALTLYALHQQSQPTGMHQTGRDLGAAVRDLRRARHTDAGELDPVLRRFHALATAASYTETLHHLGGIVTLLRGEHLTLDYVRLATDLRRLQQPALATRVRLAWGRSLYRPTPPGGPAPHGQPAPDHADPDPTGDNT